MKKLQQKEIKKINTIKGGKKDPPKDNSIDGASLPRGEWIMCN